jgi:hypothetical protein
MFKQLLSFLLVTGLSACQTSRSSTITPPVVSSSASPAIAASPTNPQSSAKCQYRRPANASNFPSPPDLPVPADKPLLAPVDSNLWGGSPVLGVGYLGVDKSASLVHDPPDYARIGSTGLDWLNQTVLPLYDAADGQVQAWIACGWVISGNPAQKARFQAKIFNPGYTALGFIVLKEQGQEWLQIRYSDRGPMAGIAWVRTADLRFGAVPLGFARWRDRYQSMMAEAIKNQKITQSNRTTDWGFLSFRNPKISHALRANPTKQSDLITWVGSDHSMKPIKIEGDWMYAQVYQPSNFCQDQWQGKVHTGWIRWTDPQQGNWLQEPYKGC